jgi:uncharacterized OsmC-like protein
MAATNARTGVDVNRLGELVERLKEHPGAGVVKCEARTRWEGGLRTHTEVSHWWRDGALHDHKGRAHTVKTDMPEALLGDNAGPSGIELVLAALASSLAVGVAAQAARRGVKLEALEMNVQGDLDIRMAVGATDRVHPGLQVVRVKMTAKADASDEVLAEIREAAERSSPVFNTLTRPVKVIATLARG